MGCPKMGVNLSVATPTVSRLHLMGCPKMGVNLSVATPTVSRLHLMGCPKMGVNPVCLLLLLL